MKARNLNTLLIAAIFLAFSSIYAASLPVTIEGEHMIRLPGSSRYIKDTLKDLPDNIIVCIPDVELASSTSAIIDGYNIKLYPGTTFKISKGAFVPLTGRFEFSSENTATNSISIVAHNCNAGYCGGHFLIEATPDNGIFFALKDNGTVWVKDIERNVFELKSGQQVHVPMFGKAVFKARLEAFWGKEPSSFNNLGEVGQEIAYGIVGSDFSYKDYKKKDDSKNENNESADNENSSDQLDDEDYLDPEEEAWLKANESAMKDENLENANAESEESSIKSED